MKITKSEFEMSDKKLKTLLDAWIKVLYADNDKNKIGKIVVNRLNSDYWAELFEDKYTYLFDDSEIETINRFINIEDIERYYNSIGLDGSKEFKRLFALSSSVSVQDKTQKIQKGFNNFKPFGETLQRFSKKPITLIYGPNSIGKSSVLGSLLYMNYINEKVAKTNPIVALLSMYNKKPFLSGSEDDKDPATNLNTTHKFGDPVDLGGFKKFVHKKDTNRHITHMSEVSDVGSTIASMLDLHWVSFGVLKYLYNFGVDNLTKSKIGFLLKLQISDTLNIHPNVKYKPKIEKESCMGAIEQLYKLILDEIENEKTNDAYFAEDQTILKEIELMQNEMIVLVLQEFLFNFVLENLPEKVEQRTQEWKSKLIARAFSSEFALEMTEKVKEYIQKEILPTLFREKQIELARSSPVKLRVERVISIKGIESSRYYFNNELMPLGDGKKECNIEEGRFSYLKELFKDKQSKLDKAMNEATVGKQMHYIGPLRFYPSRNFTDIEADEDRDAMPSSEQSWTLLKHNNILVESVNKWFSDDSKLKTPYEIKVRKLYDMEAVLSKMGEDNNVSVEELMKDVEFVEEMVFEDKRTGVQVSHRDLGLGISQILPVLIACYRNRWKHILIEQPELHLHPSVQCEIADELIRSYKKQNNEFTIETHSEHMLLRIMKRMRYANENKEDRDKTLDISPNDICILYVDSDKGTTFIKELELDSDGSLLDRWPHGFFEEGYKERFE